MEMIEAWHIWIALGFGLLALETVVPGFVLGSLAIGAFLTVLPSCFDISVSTQIIIFSFASLLSFIILRPIVMKFLNKGDQVKLNADRLVGEIGFVSKSFNGHLNKGRVRVAGDDWVAVNVGTEPLVLEDAVIVDSIESITLMVRKQENNN